MYYYVTLAGGVHLRVRAVICVFLSAMYDLHSPRQNAISLLPCVTSLLARRAAACPHANTVHYLLVVDMPYVKRTTDSIYVQVGIRSTTRHILIT